jgi:hypothetical protein
MAKNASWFEVDRDGLAEIAKRRGMSFIITEPIQNAWDEKVTRVDVQLHPVGGSPRVRIEVKDDNPDGFRDLADSYMIFRSSYKLDNPEQRGRFNVGEKLLLSVADEARVTSTKGTVIFSAKGRTRSGKRTEAGSILSARLRMTREQLREAIAFTSLLIPPPGIQTTINGRVLPSREPIAEDERSLETEVRGEEGGFRYVKRSTVLRLYETLDGERAQLYEMGIPIDKLNCPWHVEVGQKVPLSLDRASVRYGYRQAIESAAAEIMAARMDENTSREGWVTEALPSIEDDDAVRAIVTRRFGEKAVVFDPSAPESNKLALDAGYRVIHGAELPKAAWASVRRAEAIPAAGKVFSDGRVTLSRDGVPPVDRSKWTDAMVQTARYAEAFADHVLGHAMAVTFYDDAGLPFEAFCAKGQLAFNIAAPEAQRAILDGDDEALDALLIHECAHDSVEDHLTHAFHRECCRIGARSRSFYEMRFSFRIKAKAKEETS